MMPRTVHNMQPLICISAMQKCIRRGLEREAMQFACELLHTSKAYLTMVTNRLELISHEDIGIDDPTLIPLVHTCCTQAKAWYDKDKLGKSRMAVGSAIRSMCRSQHKSREGDHFQAAIGLANQLCDVKPEVPDWAYDFHTVQGRRRGRGLDHFRQDGAQLVPEPPKRDLYEDDCYIMWQVRDGHMEPSEALEHTSGDRGQFALKS